jgi:hypothetical protein
MARDAVKRVLLPVAVLALAATAAAGCKPPVEQSEFINSGMSAAVAVDASKAPPASANPPPNIVVPPPAPQPPATSADASAAK